MYTDFATLPDTARLWVYQANRTLTAAEVTQVEQQLSASLHQWAAHGQPLLASVRVVDQRFVILGLDEAYSLPSGCSIDASVRMLRELGQQLNIDFFDRSAVVKTDGQLVAYPLSTLKSAVADGQIGPDTLVCNTLVKTKSEFLTDWQLPAASTWLRRYFTAVST